MHLAMLFVFSILGLAPSPSFRRVARIDAGPPCGSYGFLVCNDSDHDGFPEVIFSTGSTNPSDLVRIEFWEHQGWNRFKLVYADTGAYPEPQGITTGNAVPYAAGDIDGDGRTDIVCTNYECYFPDSAFNIVMTLESPDSHSYPSRLSWYARTCDVLCAFTGPAYFTDLDHDGHEEILGSVPEGAWIWENVGNDSNELVGSRELFGGQKAIRDFCGDGRTYFACAGGGAAVFVHTGNFQIEMFWMDTVSGFGYDVWSTSDIDGDGRPEFYASYFNYPLRRMWLYMYEAESEGSHVFTRTLVDSLYYRGNDDWGRSSAGGDIDGDGIDECIWTTYDSVRVYKAFGDNDLRKVWDWRNDHHDTSGFNALTTTVYDVNGDGYNELLLGGNSKISIFEVDAVDLLSPNGGSCSVGDTVPIRWVANYPPRCDSVSLFLRRDSLWHLSTIATGLPPADTLYRWVVPEGVPDTGRIVVIAYGGLPSLSSDENGGCTQSAQGKWGQSLGARGRAVQSPFSGRAAWQFDMSDSAITFIGGGVEEGTSNIPLQWSLSVSPNPARGAVTVRYDVPGLGAKAGTVPQSARTRGTVPVFALGIYDAGGRLVRSLSDGAVAPGRYEVRLPAGVLPAGVYFVRLEPSAASRQPVAVTKVVVSR